MSIGVTFAQSVNVTMMIAIDLINFHTSHRVLLRHFRSKLCKKTSNEMKHVYHSMDIAKIKPVSLAGLHLLTCTGHCGVFGHLAGPSRIGSAGWSAPESSVFRMLVDKLRGMHLEDRPKVVLQENVRFVLSRAADEDCGGMVEHLQGMADLGYHTDIHLDRGELSEVPQARQRAIVVSALDERVCLSLRLAPPRHKYATPPFHSILTAAPDLTYNVSWGTVNRYVGLDGHAGVGLYKQQKDNARRYPIYTQDDTRIGPTLLGSYSKPKAPHMSDSIPYGPWVQTPLGGVRWMTEVECAKYMGFNQHECDCLPIGMRNLYKSLGNCVIVNMAEKYVHRIAQLLGCKSCMREPLLSCGGAEWKVRSHVLVHDYCTTSVRTHGESVDHWVVTVTEWVVPVA